MATEPYVKKNPGDIIRAGDWNEMQTLARDEIRSHAHTGDNDGKRIPRAGIEPNAIDGSRIDPAADVTVKSLTTGDLRVNGKAILGDIADLLASIKGLGNDKLNRAGDTVSGPFKIVNTAQDANGNTLVLGGNNNLRLGYHDSYVWIQSHNSQPLSINPLGNNVGIGTSAPSHKFHVLAQDAVGLFESSGGQAYLRLSTKEGIDNRVEITNRPGGRLSLWTSGGGDVFNITKDGKVGIGTTTPGQLLVVQGPHNASKDPDNGLSYGGQFAIKGNAPQLDFIDTDHNEWAIHVNANKMYFIRQPWNYTDLVLDGGGNVGIGTDNPKAKLTVVGEFIRKVRIATGLGPEDGTDNGQIVSRVLTITKYYADTAIRIFYCDNLRVNGNDVAARWEIRIDGKTAPGGAIVQDKYGSSGNYHEPTTILGYAQGVGAGDHTISVWVGAVPGRAVSDAYTGWNGSRWTLEAQEVWL